MRRGGHACHDPTTGITGAADRRSRWSDVHVGTATDRPRADTCLAFCVVPVLFFSELRVRLWTDVGPNHESLLLGADDSFLQEGVYEAVSVRSSRTANASHLVGGVAADDHGLR